MLSLTVEVPNFLLKSWKFAVSLIRSTFILKNIYRLWKKLIYRETDNPLDKTRQQISQQKVTILSTIKLPHRPLSTTQYRLMLISWVYLRNILGYQRHILGTFWPERTPLLHLRSWVVVFRSLSHIAPRKRFNANIYCACAIQKDFFHFITSFIELQ